MAITTDLPAPGMPDLFSGQDLTFVFPLDPVPAGGISGWTVIFGIKLHYEDGSPIFTISASVVSAANGVLQVVVPATDTSVAGGVGPGLFYWELARTDSGFNTPLGNGKLTLKPRAAQAN